MSRFSYIRYDQVSIAKQEEAKAACEALEKIVVDLLPEGRAKALALTKLEEVYMWVGKAIRDEQIHRGVMTEHKPERGE